MCGIAGVVSSEAEARSPELLRRMTDALRHRGPDDEGWAGDGDGALGARRLAIIDLALGHQPMTDESGRVIAVQNGEIYNFRELRDELTRLGHRFATGSDTEVLPHGWEEWGEALVPKLRGMFALAIWDGRSGTLLLARDRFGKKPIVYARTQRAFIFASEIQGLLVHPLVSREVDDVALDEYLSLGHIRAPRSGFRAIRKVPPAHTLVFRDGALRLHRYWTPTYAPKVVMSADEAAAELRDHIATAVRARLISDVPLGAFLSGGLDSSTVVSFMAREMPRVKTFSIGFADRRLDELPFARVVARAFDTDHHELVVEAVDADELPMLVRHLGEPFADSSIIPTYQVARLTREQVTVALTGDGGDELFGGYDRYRAALVADLLDRLPATAGIRRVAASLPAGKPRLRSLRRLLLGVGLGADRRYLRWVGYFPRDGGAPIRGPRTAAVGAEGLAPLSDAAALTGASDPAELHMAADLAFGLPADMLVKMDIATMASSLEARSPLLDYQLAEFVMRLPARDKVSPFGSKRLLRHAMRDILPPEVLRRRKMGFTAPVGEWLRGPMNARFRDLVLATDALAREHVDQRVARRLLDEHAAGRADHTRQLWSLLMLELWFRECVVRD